MTPKEKEVLLKDLCARLPNGGNHIPEKEIVFYNKRHFDYRVLIPLPEKDLLLEDICARLPYGLK